MKSLPCPDGCVPGNLDLDCRSCYGSGTVDYCDKCNSILSPELEPFGLCFGCDILDLNDFEKIQDNARSRKN